jgi:hypothetical protein
MPGGPNPALTYAEAAGGQRKTSSASVCPATTAKEPPVPADQNEPATPPPASTTQSEPTTIPPVRRRNRHRGSQNAQPTRKQPERNRRPVYDVNNPNSEWRK